MFLCLETHLTTILSISISFSLTKNTLVNYSLLFLKLDGLFILDTDVSDRVVSTEELPSLKWMGEKYSLETCMQANPYQSNKD